MPAQDSIQTERKKLKYVKKVEKGGIIFSISRVQKKMKEGHYTKRIGVSAAVYLSAVLGYLTTEVLEISGDFATEDTKHHHLIQPKFMMMAFQKDEEHGAFKTPKPHISEMFWNKLNKYLIIYITS